jgi:2-methylisocitrate lyase-like PEP mutase family enzyme
MSLNEATAKKFKELVFTTDRCLVGPGVFDGISTLVAGTIGFDFLYLTGAGATGSVTGHPDLSVMTATEFADLARMMAGATNIPIIADADTGFGGPINIQRTVHLYESAGVSGMHIEDQTFPKRCGQLAGKNVEPIEVYLERIHAAVSARSSPDFLIIARTDARNATNFGGENADEEAFQEGVKRLQEALKAGADMAFMESPRTIEECKELVKACAPKPVLLNILPNGLTPALTAKQCTELGFKAVIFPCTGFIPAMLAMQRSYKALKEKGTDLDNCEGHKIQDFFQQMGLQKAYNFDKTVTENAEREAKEEK